MSELIPTKTGILLQCTGTQEPWHTRHRCSQKCWLCDAEEGACSNNFFKNITLSKINNTVIIVYTLISDIMYNVMSVLGWGWLTQILNTSQASTNEPFILVLFGNLHKCHDQNLPTITDGVEHLLERKKNYAATFKMNNILTTGLWSTKQINSSH